MLLKMPNKIQKLMRLRLRDDLNRKGFHSLGVNQFEKNFGIEILALFGPVSFNFSIANTLFIVRFLRGG